MISSNDRILLMAERELAFVDELDMEEFVWFNNRIDAIELLTQEERVS